MGSLINKENRHILANFDSLLGKLHDSFLMMAGLTERNLKNSMEGFFRRDDDFCTQTIADEDEIDQIEKQIDQDGVEIIRRFQPVASDLRQVLATMKLSSHLERISDQAVNIAKRSRKLNQAPLFEEARRLEPMFHEAIGMVKEAIAGFLNHDVEIANSIRPRDKRLDQLNRETADFFASCMTENTERITDLVNLLLIGRHLERIGDHAKNIAEGAVFAASAEDIRHPRLSRAFQAA